MSIHWRLPSKVLAYLPRFPRLADILTPLIAEACFERYHPRHRRHVRESFLHMTNKNIGEKGNGEGRSVIYLERVVDAHCKCYCAPLAVHYYMELSGNEQK